MRKALEDLIKKSIVYKYDLPYVVGSVPRTIFSTLDDKCYAVSDNDSLIKIIYNSIIDYSFNELDFTERELEDLHTIAFQERIRYDEDDSDATKQKYGFFGEVILHSILKVFFGTQTFISKGYFYNPLENSESKGYDAYHLIEHDSKVHLWFGETKFHQSYTQAVNDVLSKIKNSLSDKYLSKNLLALRKNKDNLNLKGSKIEKILIDWTENPNIKIIEEIKQHSIELVYPVIILFQQNKKGYDESIKAIPKYIEEKHKLEKYDLSIPYSVFFVFLPVEDVKLVKSEVIKWIESKKPLMS
ncbi:Hachiman antiphage defense system protein HamA [Polaribacter sp. Hel1_85]|uniref:Hachiman antiphage defense system protein HamA n=1 Tax=Polaribacter sp. Hel1_85 TaxID=1250005 RepID=UPI00052D361A|nr:Hachiman antiphage defense system protein HamA [Polaribacter sp. Hel1_85]KGL63654.1 hypothetical protein PHEL85_0693 [Polaribacter sp. Hel1_85]